MLAQYNNNLNNRLLEGKKVWYFCSDKYNSSNIITKMIKCYFIQINIYYEW